MTENYCISCGAEIPEGRHICMDCENKKLQKRIFDAYAYNAYGDLMHHTSGDIDLIMHWLQIVTLGYNFGKITIKERTDE